MPVCRTGAGGLADSGTALPCLRHTGAFARAARCLSLIHIYLINSYFEAPRHHTLLVQLLDCRHAPSADDLQMLRYLHYHRIPYVVALTKADKLKKSQLAKTQEDFENICRPYGCQKVVLTSGENGYGIPELQAVLNAAVAAENEEAE